MSCGQPGRTTGRWAAAGSYKQMNIHSGGIGKPLQFEAGPIPELSVSKQQAWSTPRTSCLAEGALELCGDAPGLCVCVSLTSNPLCGDSCIPHRLQRPNMICY